MVIYSSEDWIFSDFFLWHIIIVSSYSVRWSDSYFVKYWILNFFNLICQKTSQNDKLFRFDLHLLQNRRIKSSFNWNLVRFFPKISFKVNWAYPYILCFVLFISIQFYFVTKKKFMLEKIGKKLKKGRRMCKYWYLF